jgi:large subunit ribosomal protein L29
MTKKNMDEIRIKDTESLAKDLNALRKDLFDLRFKSVTDQLERNTEMRNTRKKIARILTVMRERETAARSAK